MCSKNHLGNCTLEMNDYGQAKMQLFANPKPEIFKIKLDGQSVNSGVVSVLEPIEEVVEYFFNYSRSRVLLYDWDSLRLFFSGQPLGF